jgi:predicted ATPase
MPVLSSFRAYYLDPRTAMRTSQAPREVQDVGPLGAQLAPFLYRLGAEHPRVFDAVRRTLRTIVPSVEDLSVDLDPRRGVLDVEVRQDGTTFSSRIVSEGILRVLALLCTVLNPWSGSLVAFEEPESGVHPRRIELVAEMLTSLVLKEKPTRQLILTSHSPVFWTAMLRRAKEHGDRISLYRVFREGRDTHCERFDPSDPLLEDREVQKSLSTSEPERVFEGMFLRGLFDA